MSVLGYRALEWMVKNHVGLKNYLDGMEGPYSDTKKELLEIIKEYAGEKEDKWSIMPSKRHFFLLSVDINLSRTIVKNYVERAIKYFHKHDDQKALEGVSRPKFHLIMLPEKEDEQHAIVETVMLTKKVKEFFHTMFDTIEK